MRNASDMRMILKLARYKQNKDYENLPNGVEKESISFCEDWIARELNASASKEKDFCVIHLGYCPYTSVEINYDEVYLVTEDGYVLSTGGRSRFIHNPCSPMSLNIIRSYLINHGYKIETHEITYKHFRYGDLGGIDLTVKFP